MGILEGCQVSYRGLGHPRLTVFHGDYDASFCHGCHCLCLWEQAVWEQESLLVSLVRSICVPCPPRNVKGG